MKNKCFGLLLIFLIVPFIIIAQVSFNSEFLNSFEFRNFGAHRVGAWVSCIAVPDNPGDKYKYTFFVAARNGGVWKTINNGTTFYPVFEKYGVNTIGAMAIAPSDPDIVWVGTGDAYNSRSSMAGNGIYKSTDGGENFTNMGLQDVQHIAKILIHPQKPDILYAACMGHLYSANTERGVYKTTDGGKTWQKVLYINEVVGVIDLVMNPANPDILYASAYEKIRLPWHLEAGGPGSAVYKTTDGGLNWTKLTGGLPDGILGRIGLALCQKSPDVIYALVENLNPKDPTNKISSQNMMDVNRDNYYDQFKGGEIYKSRDNGKSWEKMNGDKQNLSSKTAYSFNQIFVDPNEENNLFVLSAEMHLSIDGGKTWTGFDRKPNPLFSTMFGDYRTLWIDYHDSRHMMAGSDGGAYVTWDGGKSMYHYYHIPLGEIYAVEADMTEPYHIYFGLQDHEAWRAPSNGWSGMVSLEDWTLVGSGDGMYVKVDQENNRWIYSTGQFGQHLRADLWKGERKDIMPKSAKDKPAYRFTWATPLIMSTHNNSILYTGAQMVLRSLDRGEQWDEISPDLTTNDSIRQNGRGHIKYCTITSLAESSIKPGLIWAGTDDGKVHVFDPKSSAWQECTASLTAAGCPADFWVTRVFSSFSDPATAYVTKSGYTRDDFRPFVFKTTDYGKTWTNISSNLPNQPVNVIWEDRDNPELLFLGTDAGLYASINGGKNWVQFTQIPPAPVKDVMVHFRENDLLVGTYGRGLYVTDISPLKVIKEDFFKKEAFLFEVEPKPKLNYSEQVYWGNRQLMGNSHLFTPNEPNGLMIYYYLRDKQKQAPKIEIWNTSDSLVSTIECKTDPGLFKVIWDTEKQKTGEYKLKMLINKKEYSTKGIVKPAWEWPIGNQDVLRNRLK